MNGIDPVKTHAEHRPHSQALVDLESGMRWTYGELHATLDRLAAWLVGEFGPASGVRVSTLARNCAQMLILQLAGVRAGTIFVPLNWRLAPVEIETLTGDAAPELLFFDSDFAPPSAVRRVLPTTRMLDLGRSGARPPTAARRPFEAVSTLLYTSGTTGQPKGVMLSERNAFWSCTNFIYGHNVTANSVLLCDVPLFHVAGLYAAARAPVLAGAGVLISRGFGARVTFERLSDPALGITHYFSVPQMAERIWDEPGFDPEPLRELVDWSIGGAPNPTGNTKRFVRAGIRLAEGFGMTESGSAFAMPTQDMELVLQKAGSCGLPLLCTEARIVDGDGNDLAPGRTGELWLRGPNIARGYWKRPETTAEAFCGGWFMTGDAAMQDADGFFYIVDRHKDMYISGGENVYPAEVEAAIAEPAEVAESAVIGVPDERWGEVGRAYVVPALGRTITPESVLDQCRKRLARFKIPKTVVITDTLPRTASGKLQKHVLKERAAREMAPD